jgi:hypothetical protein
VIINTWIRHDGGMDRGMISSRPVRRIEGDDSDTRVGNVTISIRIHTHEWEGEMTGDEARSLAFQLHRDADKVEQFLKGQPLPDKEAPHG